MYFYWFYSILCQLHYFSYHDDIGRQFTLSEQLMPQFMKQLKEKNGSKVYCFPSRWINLMNKIRKDALWRRIALEGCLKWYQLLGCTFVIEDSCSWKKSSIKNLTIFLKELFQLPNCWWYLKKKYFSNMIFCTKVHT